MQKRNLGVLALGLMGLAACGGGGSDGGIGLAGAEAVPAAGADAGSSAPSTDTAASGVTTGPGAGTTGSLSPPALGPSLLASNSKPVLTGSAPPRVRAYAEYAFQPTASDADGDPLQFSIANLPPWATFDATSGRIHGRPQPTDVRTYGPITLAVSDGTHTVSLPAFELDVLPVQDKGIITLAWKLPNQMEDGSPLVQAPIVRVHYGRASRGYENAVTLPERGATRYVLTDLSAGTWYVATTAVDPDGLESAFSTETAAQVN